MSTEGSLGYYSLRRDKVFGDDTQDVDDCAQQIGGLSPSPPASQREE